MRTPLPPLPHLIVSKLSDTTMTVSVKVFVDLGHAWLAVLRPFWRKHPHPRPLSLEGRGETRLRPLSVTGRGEIGDRERGKTNV